MFFTIEEGKETVLDFLQKTEKVLQFHFGYQCKMTQYNNLNVYMTNSYLSILKSGI